MNLPSKHQSYDCITIGGGPGGCTAATILSDLGHRVLLIEKAPAPRHKIGESLMPETYWTFKRMGMLEKLKASNFVRKESVQFVNAMGADSAPFYFADRDPNEWSTTWQVKRDEFDGMLLDNAREHGVEVREGALVKQVIFDGSRAVGVRAMLDGELCDLGCKVVVDASGLGAVIGKQLKLREGDAGLRNAAIYCYYKGAYRDEGRNAGATIVIKTGNNDGWFWYIPLADDVTSIGVVGPSQWLCAGRGNDPLVTFLEEVENAPGVKRRIAGADRLSGPFVTSDFTYRCSQIAGDGWVVAGDAFGFLDPIYSSGVMLALKSGELAADSVHEALASGDLTAATLGRHGPDFLRGMSLMRKLVYAYYDPRFSFGAFIRKHPDQRDNITRLLIGDVFNDDVGKVFDLMKDWSDLPDMMFLQSDQAVPTAPTHAGASAP